MPQEVRDGRRGHYALRVRKGHVQSIPVGWTALLRIKRPAAAPQPSASRLSLMLEISSAGCLGLAVPSWTTNVLPVFCALLRSQWRFVGESELAIASSSETLPVV